MAHHDLKTEQPQAKWRRKLRAGDNRNADRHWSTPRATPHTRRSLRAMDAGDKLPFDLDGAAIYYAGPTPAKPGQGHRLRSARPPPAVWTRSHRVCSMQVLPA